MPFIILNDVNFTFNYTVASKVSTSPHEVMQECDACGLVFGGSQVCPGCGSRTSHHAKVSEESGKLVPSGDLPGLNELVTSMDGVNTIDVEAKKVAKTSLPFTIGGSSGGDTSLPFGVGSPSRGIEVENPIIPSQPKEVGAVSDVDSSEILEDTSAEVDDVSGIIDSTPESSLVDGDSPSESEVQVVSLSQPEEEVVLVARVIGEITPEDVTPEISKDVQETTTLDDSFVGGNEISNSASPVVSDSSHTYSDGSVAGVDQDVILHQEDVIYHDFGDEMQVSEVVVDFDSWVDPATSAVAFDPTLIAGEEPELMPARAQAVVGLEAGKLQELAHIGFAALAEANWKKAADCFRGICEVQPKNAAALNNFGLSLLQQALLIQEERPSDNPADDPHFEASVLALRQAAKASGKDVAVISNLATALSSCHRHETAIKFFDAALTIDSTDISSINGKAVSLIAIRDFDQATLLLRHAVELDPGNEIVSGNLHRISPMG